MRNTITKWSEYRDCEIINVSSVGVQEILKKILPLLRPDCKLRGDCPLEYYILLRSTSACAVPKIMRLL